MIAALTMMMMMMMGSLCYGMTERINGAERSYGLCGRGGRRELLSQPSVADK